jgi:ATP-binding cassette, subfamily B, bacterial
MLKKIKEFLKINPYSRQYYVLIILDTIKGYIGIITEALLIKIIGDGIIEKNYAKVYIAVIFTILIAIIMFVSLYTMTLRLDKMKGKLVAFLRGTFVISFFNHNSERQHNIDNLYYILTNDTSVIKNFYESFHRLIGSFNRFIASLVVGIIISWQLCIVILVLSMIKVVVSKFIISKMDETINNTVIINSKILSNILEVFEASPFFRFLNKLFPHIYFNNLYEQYRPVYKKETTYTVRLTTLSSFLDMIAIVALLVIGSLLSYYGFTTISSIAAFISIQDTMTNPITFIGNFIKDFKYQSISFERYITEMEKSTAGVPENSEIYEDAVSEINIENLDFSYMENGKPVFKNLNARIASDHITYILGESGAGKTSLVKLITGVLKPDSGKIEFLIDGVSIQNPKICYTSQTPIFLRGSVAENISLSLKPDCRKVNNAIEKAQLVFLNKDEISSFIIDSKASNLSSGQKVRLALARAFYHESNVMVFDEIFSSIDNFLISNILPQLEEISQQGRIVIIISHRQEWIPLDAYKIIINPE